MLKKLARFGLLLAALILAAHPAPGRSESVQASTRLLRTA